MAALVLLAPLACRDSHDVAQRPASCPVEAPAPARMPRTLPEHQSLEYWLARAGEQFDLDEVLLSTEDVARFDSPPAGVETASLRGRRDLLAPVHADDLRASVREMLAFVRERVSQARYVDERGRAFGADMLAALEESRIPVDFVPSLHVALSDTPLHCAPTSAGFYVEPVDLGHDVNACSTAHPQEVIQLLAEWPGGMRLARTRYAMGWITPDSHLSAEIPKPLRATFVHGERLRAREALDLSTLDGERFPIEKHTLLPYLAVSPGLAVVASKRAFHAAPVSADLVSTRRPVTRRSLLETAFGFLDSPYGYGGLGAGRDCSRLMLDLFESFGLELPRYSGWQARAGTFTIEVADVQDARDKLALADAALRHGVVLLHFPGHIMLYLGHDARGVPMVLHALGQYRERCGDTDFDTLYTLRRVTVSDLELGKTAGGHSYLERVSEIAVFGHEPDSDMRAMIEHISPGPALVVGVAR